MASLSVPVCLVSEEEQCTDIIRVPADGMSTLSQFQRQLAIGLLKGGKLLKGLSFRGNSVNGDGRLHQFAAVNARRPRFAAEYTVIPPNHTNELFFVKAPTGKMLNIEFK